MYHTTHNYTRGLLSQEKEDVCSQKILDKSVLHSSTCNILKLETSQMSFTGKTKPKNLMALLYYLEIRGKTSARVAIHDYNPVLWRLRENWQDSRLSWSTEQDTVRKKVAGCGGTGL